MQSYFSDKDYQLCHLVSNISFVVRFKDTFFFQIKVFDLVPFLCTDAILEVGRKLKLYVDALSKYSISLNLLIWQIVGLQDFALLF